MIEHHTTIRSESPHKAISEFLRGLGPQIWRLELCDYWCFGRFNWGNSSHCLHEKKRQWCTDVKSCTWHMADIKDNLHVSSTFESQTSCIT